MKYLYPILAFMLVGCGLARQQYFEKDYMVGDTKMANVGDVMVAWEQGTKNHVYNYVVSGVKSELIYNGLSDSTIYIAYR